MQTAHGARFKESLKYSRKRIHFFASIIAFVGVVVVVVVFSTWTLNRIRIRWLPYTESITLADRNNQIQFKSKVHILGSFMPDDSICIICRTVWVAFLFSVAEVYALDVRTIRDPYHHHHRCCDSATTVYPQENYFRIVLRTKLSIVAFFFPAFLPSSFSRLISWTFFSLHFHENRFIAWQCSEITCTFTAHEETNEEIGTQSFNCVLVVSSVFAFKWNIIIFN